MDISVPSFFIAKQGFGCQAKELGYMPPKGGEADLRKSTNSLKTSLGIPGISGTAPTPESVLIADGAEAAGSDLSLG